MDQFRACDFCHSWNVEFEHESEIVCKQCQKEPIFCHSLGTLPSLTIPDIFGELTFAETLLIARAQPVISVIFLPKGGQLALRKHSITFEKTNLADFGALLPRLPSEIETLIVASESEGRMLPEFRVRRRKVEEALRTLHGLQRDNPSMPYSTIIIDDERLAALPENDSIIDALPTITDFDAGEIVDVQPGSPDVQQDDSAIEERNRLFESFVLTNHENRTELEALQETIRVRNASLNTETPLFERSDYFFSKCYPHLFPDTCGDFTSPHFNPGNHVNVLFRSWVGHLLSFDAERFTHDRLFKFHAYNIHMKKSALGLTRAFCSPDTLLQNLTVGEIMNAVEVGDTSIIRKLQRFTRSLEGSPQYKYGKRRDLVAMVKTLGIPKYFITLSAADRDWPIVQPNPRAHPRERNRYINEHSAKIVHLFKQKSRILIEEFTPELNITDSFVMYEFQSRGSIHLHALYWADTDENNPVQQPYHEKINMLSNATEEARANDPYLLELSEALRLEFEKICTAMDPFQDPNTNTDAPVPDPTMASRPQSYLASEIKHDENVDLACLIAASQIHSHGPWCKRTKNGEEYCRYGFHKKNRSAVEQAIHYDEKNQMTFVAQRNHGYVNTYNPDFMRLHRANHDIRPVTNMGAVLSYITKYICKSEPPSEMFKTLKKMVANPRRPLNEADPGLKLLSRYVMRDIARDVSAQEIDLYFLGHHLCEASRRFSYLTINSQKTCIQLVNGAPKLRYSEYVKYLNRSAIFSSYSFIEMTRRFYLDNNGNWTLRLQRRSLKKLILVYFPEITNVRTDLYWKIRCLACIPCSSVDDCLGNNASWLQRALQARNDGISLKIYPNEPDPFVLWDRSLLEDENAELAALAEENELPERIGFTAPPDAQNVFSTLTLGNTSDEQADMVDAMLIDDNPIDKVAEHLRMQQEFGVPHESYHIAAAMWEHPVLPTALPTVDLSALNNKQLQAFRYGVAALKGLHTNSLILHGVGGTGKSYVICCLLKWASMNMAEGVATILVAAPSGIAASLLPTGKTIHTALKLDIPLESNRPLNTARLGHLQADIKHVKLVILDEFSMIGSRMLACVDKRLRQCRPANGHLPFGGISVILSGDIAQLPPVMDPHFIESQSISDSALVTHGKSLFPTASEWQMSFSRTTLSQSLVHTCKHPRSNHREFVQYNQFHMFYISL